MEGVFIFFQTFLTRFFVRETSLLGLFGFQALCLHIPSIRNRMWVTKEVESMKIQKMLLILVLGLTLSLAACDIATTTTTDAGTTLTDLRVFTLAELATYNGNNGSTAYIAVDGTVYDVTNVAEWSNGWHKGMHLAGTNCTSVFNGSPHSASFLSQLTIVGTLQN
jgi:predicted heme/steroid binding protein